MYFITGQLGLSVTDDTLGTSMTDTATVVVSRPGGCVAQSLQVNYTLGGTAVNGADYTISPASGSLVLTAGTTSATITMTPKLPLNTSGSSKSIVIALAPGAYAIGPSSNATCTLANTVYVPPALVMDDDWYVDENDNGIVKRSSNNAYVLAPYMMSTNLDGITYNYMYVLASLDMNNHTIWGKKVLYSGANVPYGYWSVAGDVTGAGSWDYGHPTGGGGYGGCLRVEAGGSITVSNVITETEFGGYLSRLWSSGLHLWAKNGRLTITGYIWICGGCNTEHMYPCVLRSDGSGVNRGIRILGTVSRSVWTTESTNVNQTVTRNFSIFNGTPEGDVANTVGLYTQGDIEMAGGFYQPSSGDGSRFLVTGSYTDGTARAGNVNIGGDLILYGTGFYPGVYGGYPGVTFAGVGDNWVAITATSVRVQGRIDTRVGAWSANRGGGVYIDSLQEAIVEGFIDTYGTIHPYIVNTTPGPVWIKALHIAVCGTNENGESIRTKPVPHPNGSPWPSAYNDYNWNNARMGDGDVTLQGIDTSAAWFDPRRPLTGATSSILVSGKIVTAYCNVPKIEGNVYLSAVGVYLYGNIATSNSPPVTNVFHCGVQTHGIKTHLIENSVQWGGGAAPHNLNYGPATTWFFPDVPYAGSYGSQGTALIIQ